MPSFNPFGSSKNVATLFEIRLEQDLIVLRGSEDEAASQILRGVVVLCLPSSLKIEDVHLRMTGHSKMGVEENMRLTSSGALRNEQLREIFSHKWPAFVGGEGTNSSSKSITLAATNYEWPFELVIPGSMLESIEGLNDVRVVYNLKATVARGRLSSDLHAYKPVRIIRTLAPSDLELAHAMTVENVWPNKVEYSLNIPQKAVVFGTNIQIEMSFTPLLKGLKIGTIKCNLVETHDWTIYTYGENHYKKTRDIAAWSFELNEEEHYHDMMNESGQNGWVLKESLPLPKSLKLCVQDVDTEKIKIKHKVKFIIALENPDGHVSELRASLPVTVFISPNMPIDESGNLLDQTPNSSQSVDIDAHAPPIYGEHVLDQLYADIDTSGFRTPAPQSGMSTPFYNRSNSGSAENVTSMDSIAGTEIRPEVLSSRLQNLNTGLLGNNSFLRRNGSGSGGNTPLNHGHGSSASLSWALNQQQDQNSGPTSVPLSRRTSGEENGEGQNSGMTSGRHTPEHIDYSDIDLTRVPSYMTAVRAPPRVSSYTDVQTLPNYETAISAPPSPQPAPSNLANTTEGSGSGANVTRVSGTRPLNPSAGVGLISFSRGDHGAMDSDAGRRFHLLQARAWAH